MAAAVEFRGAIMTLARYINGGKPCERKGDFHFPIKGPHAFWRLQEMNNPCDIATDCVDIYRK